jgi:dynein heavy chain, axonemal
VGSALQVVELVRGQALSKLERATLSAVVVMDVHARDIAALLAKRRVATVDDFAWMSQLRCGSIWVSAVILVPS